MEKEIPKHLKDVPADKLDTLNEIHKPRNFISFAEDLAESVPVIEAAIMGGTIEKFGLFNDVDFKGLASPDIKYAEATENILALRNALGESVEIPADVSLSNRTNELGNNLNQFNESGPPVVISNDQSQQIVNNQSSKASIAIAKNVNPPDQTINAINPRLSLYNQ